MNFNSLFEIIITGRNEVVAKIIFLLVFVILFTGGVYLSACWDTTSQEGSKPSPKGNTPSEGSTPPPSIRSMNGRHASYWYAFLLKIKHYTQKFGGKTSIKSS